MQLKHFNLTISLVFSLLTFSSYVFSESSQALKIGILVPLSGNYAPAGIDAKQGIEVGLQLSGSQEKFKMLYADSKAEPTTSVNEFRKLSVIDEVVSIYVLRGPVGMAVNPLSKDSQLPLLGGVGVSNFVSSNPYAFQTWSAAPEEGDFLAEKMLEEKLRKVAVITAQDDWNISVSSEFIQALKRRGGSIVFEQEVMPNETDFRTLLLRMQKAAPEAVFFNIGIGQMGSFLKQAKEFRIKLPLYSNFWVSKKDVLETSGIDAIEGVKFTEMDTNLPVLKEKLLSKYSASPSGATLSAYVSVMLLAQTLKDKPQISNTAELYSALMEQRQIITPDYTYKIHDRRIIFPLTLKTIRDGKPE